MVDSHEYREGGWGWMVVLSAFVAEFIMIGTMKAFGILITAMKDDLDEDLWIIGSIGALFFGVQFVLTPVASAVAHKVGGRPVVAFGGILCGLGLVLSMTTYSIPLIAVYLAVLAGTGSACTNVITRSELAFYFRDRYAMASSIVFVGAPLSMMLYGPMTQVLLDTYGWRGAMLIIGGIGFHLIWAGCLLRRPTGIYAVLPREEPSADEEEPRDALPSSELRSPTPPQGNRWRSFSKFIGLDVLLNLEFLLLAGVRICDNIALGGILVYMVPNALALGLSPQEASFLTTAFGLGSLGALLLGAFVSHSSAPPLPFSAALASCLAAISLALAPLLSSLISQLIIMCITGFGLLFVIQSVGVLARSLPFSDDKFVLVLGWLAFLGGIMSSIVDTLSGYMYDVTESFRGTFFLYSGSMVGCVMFLLLGYIRTRWTNRNTETHI